MKSSTVGGLIPKLSFIFSWKPSATSTLTDFKDFFFDRVIIMPVMTYASKVWSEPFVGNVESASAARWLIPGSWTISKLKSIKRSLQRASLLVASESSRIQLDASYSMCKMNLSPSKYGRINKRAQTTVWQSRCRVSSFCFLKICDLHAIRLGVLPLSCSCKITHVICFWTRIWV